MNEKEKDLISGLLTAALQKPAAPLRLPEKLTAIDILRRWIYLIVVAIVGITIIALQVRQNSAIVKEIRPMVKVMWWMKENGLTNKDIAPHGPVKPPDYD